MAGYDDDEDLFDDDLDDLPVNAFAELEHNAIQFTQAQTQAALVKAPPSSDYGEFEDDDLDDAVVIDEAKSVLAVPPAPHRNRTGQPTQREQFRQQRYGTISNPRSRPQQEPALSVPERPTPQPLSIANGQHESIVAQQGNSPATAHKVDALQKQIQELLKERNVLKQDLNSKAGEIAIVRGKQEKTVKEYEREMTAIRKLNADQIAKQQKALEAARIAEKNAAIERDFIKQDLAEESERVRRLARAKEGEKKDAGAAATTPKKKQALPHRDGFDDDEIEILSPSRVSPSKYQKRNATSPAKAGAKRKRKTVESPAAALEVIQSEEPSIDQQTKTLALDPAIIENLGRQDDRLDFLGIMLDHRPNGGQLRTLEELGKQSLPSRPEESFESKILGTLPTFGLKRFAADLPVEFCELLISMWSDCMEEKYLKPIYLFLDLLGFALELKTTSIAPHIIDSLVPLVQRTADLVAIPRFNSASPDQYLKDIDVSSCLALLHLAALGCMSEQQQIIRFWKLMRWDFVLLILSQNQPTPDYKMMLSILSTSVFKESFGAISTEEATQSLHVGYIIDRLTYHLWETPYLPMSTEKVPATELLRIRLQILQLLISMMRSPFAGKALALHPNAIGRIVSLMSDELDVLYDYKAGHRESARLISLATRLLYHLVTVYDQLIDIQKKLSSIHGGSQKYLLCLARLNFAEDDLVLESGIDPDVAGWALEMLELAVTPEEGDAIHSAFSAA